jgi:CheY-like chemotaxis protein
MASINWGLARDAVSATQSRNDAVVLLADDSADDVSLFERAYRAAGIPHTLSVVTDGRRAIEYLQRSASTPPRKGYPRPVLLFLDLKMPKVDGFRVLQWVRHESQMKQLPIIVLATPGSLDDVRRAYALGANSFVAKSGSEDELVSELQGVKQHWLTR